MKGQRMKGQRMKVDSSALEQNELVTTLTQSEKDTLLDMAIGRSYPAGEIIFKENDEAWSVILLLKGRVALQMDIGNNRQLMVSTVDANEITAWSGLVPPYQFTATARAITDCELAIFLSEDLRRHFDENPRLGYMFMQRVACAAAEHVRDAQLQLVGLFGT